MALLNFIHVTDICTVIGNALDNPIESVVMIEDFEKRIIHFSLSKKKQFIFLQIRNYCENPPLWNGKSLITTKKDKKIMATVLKVLNIPLKNMTEI